MDWLVWYSGVVWKSVGRNSWLTQLNQLLRYLYSRIETTIKWYMLPWYHPRSARLFGPGIESHWATRIIREFGHCCWPIRTKQAECDVETGISSFPELQTHKHPVKTTRNFLNCSKERSPRSTVLMYLGWNKQNKTCIMVFWVHGCYGDIIIVSLTPSQALQSSVHFPSVQMQTIHSTVHIPCDNTWP